MDLARVIGTVVSSTVYEGLESVRLLVVQPMNSQMEDTGDPIVATDAVQAGRGDIVYIVGSREASMGLEISFVPVDACIVGHVDAVGDLRTSESLDRGGSA